MAEGWRPRAFRLSARGISTAPTQRLGEFSMNPTAAIFAPGAVTLSVNLEERNPLHDWDHVHSAQVFQGRDVAHPLLTIVITVYKRHDHLLDAISSALSQSIGAPIEILVVDDDPASQKLSGILEGMPALAARNFRYFVNDRNLGLFGNWNRGISLARAPWVTILNDDDLLDGDCMTRLFGVIAADESVDAIIPAKRYLDERAGSETGSGIAAAPPGGQGLMQKLNRLVTTREGRRVLLPTLFGYLRAFTLFGFARSRRLRPHIFFWGNVLGNPVGFVFKKDCALALGGFYAEEYPSSDHLFFARFADRFHFRQHRDVGASFRIATNESLKPDTILDGMKRSLDLQRMMAGRQVPRWWLLMSPQVMAYHHADGLRFLGARLPISRVEDALGMDIPKERRRLLALARLILRGS